MIFSRFLFNRVTIFLFSLVNSIIAKELSADELYQQHSFMVLDSLLSLPADADAGTTTAAAAKVEGNNRRQKRKQQQQSALFLHQVEDVLSCGDAWLEVPPVSMTIRIS